MCTQVTSCTEFKLLGESCKKLENKIGSRVGNYFFGFIADFVTLDL